MVALGRIELPTQGFSVLCSTDWATEPHMAVSTRFELAIFCVTGRRDNHYTTRPILVAEAGFEPTTFGLWAQRATKLLHSAMYGGERGIRTPAPSPTSRFSRPVPSTRLGYFSTTWCLRPDLNRHGIWLPQDFKSCASTNFATQAHHNKT